MRQVIETFVKKYANDWSMNLVSMLTYNLITTLFPILLAILTVASFILSLLSPHAFHDVATMMSAAVPQNLRSVIHFDTLLENLTHSTEPLALISVASLMWAGSNVFGNMENAFSIIFRTEGRGFLHQKLMAIAMVIILAILLPLSLAATSVLTAGSRIFQTSLQLPLGDLPRWIGPLMSLAMLWILFLIIYIVVPNMSVPFRVAWRGAIVAALLFTTFQLLFPLYFTLALSGNEKYGAIAASILVLIAWLWFFALFTIIGAQVNAVAMGIHATKQDLARTFRADYHASRHVVPTRGSGDVS